MNSSNGGMVWITNTYYAPNATVANPITIEAYQSWPGANGTVTFDGTGITLGGTTGWGLIHVSVGGLYFNGKVTDGITVQNSRWNGISCYTATQVPGPSFKYLRLYSNGTASTTDSTGAAEAQIKVLYASGGTCDSCNFDGNNQFINGILFGESYVSVIGYTVSNCTFMNHRGTSPDDDCGIGVKAQNSQITVANCTMHNNDKGVDLGENQGANANILYKVINCTSYNNTMFGLACSGPGNRSYSGTVNFYFINCIVYNNPMGGFVTYSGPFNVYFMHCVSDGNGSGDIQGNANFQLWEEYSPDAPIYIRIYNSIGYKPAANNNLAMWAFNKTSGYFLTIDSDFNCWRPRATENFALWDYFNRSGQARFTYAQGPGSTLTNWYLWYDFAANPSAYGNGHYHCDSNSVTLEPPFTDAANHDYTLTETFPGTNLTYMPWYIPEMGLDRNGQTRGTWCMGPYEATGGTLIPGAPRRLRLK
jgi:hypothetical protein